MLPILFKAGPLTIYSWGFFLAASFLLATFILWREGKRQGYNEERLLDLSIICLLSALIGGRAFYILQNINLFKGDSASILYFWQGGFVYYGALLGVIIAAAYFIRAWKWSFFQIADIGALATNAALVLIKIGAFLAGIEIGKETNAAWAVKYPGFSFNRHPVQLYEAATYLIFLIFLYLLYFRNLASREMKSGKIFFTFLVITSIAQAIFELYKEGQGTFFSWPKTSIFSFIIATTAVFALYYFKIRNFREDGQNLLKIITGSGRFLLHKIHLR